MANDTASKWTSAIELLDFLRKASEPTQRELNEADYAFRTLMLEKQNSQDLYNRKIDTVERRMISLNEEILKATERENQIRNKIVSLDGEIDKIEPWKAPKAKEFVRNLYQHQTEVEVDYLENSWREMLDLTNVKDSINHNIQALETDLTSEIERKAQEDKVQKDKLEAMNLELITSRVTNQNLLNKDKYDKITLTDPASHLSNLESAYANISDQLETLYTEENVLTMIESMPNWADMNDADKAFISKQIPMMIMNNASGSAFLNSLDNVDQSIKQWWMDPMNPAAQSIESIFEADYLYDRSVASYAKQFQNTLSNNQVTNQPPASTYNVQSMSAKSQKITVKKDDD